MTFIETIIYSLIQGIGEFIPISSSANLFLINEIFNYGNLSLSSEIIFHVGSLLALIGYFYREILHIILGLFTSKEKLSNTYFWPLILSTLPVVVFTLIFKDNLNKNNYTGYMLIIFGLILFIVDKYANRISITIKNVYLKYLILGCFQSISIISGVSRLGICITGCRLLGFSREKSISTALLLDIPSICGSLIFAIYNGENISYTQNTLFTCVLIGLIGLFCIFPCINYMRKYGFGLITIYRIVIGLLLIYLK